MNAFAKAEKATKEFEEKMVGLLPEYVEYLDKKQPQLRAVYICDEYNDYDSEDINNYLYSKIESKEDFIDIVKKYREIEDIEGLEPSSRDVWKMINPHLRPDLSRDIYEELGKFQLDFLFGYWAILIYRNFNNDLLFELFL